QNDVTLKMPAFEWVHVQLHQQKGMISLSPPTICNSAVTVTLVMEETETVYAPEVVWVESCPFSKDEGKKTGEE
ncbi:hypothetical protein M2A40_28275, partial [Klebsiella pneumoniae]|nr:hypothetical protein [Klebsiella pneumoniae]